MAEVERYRKRIDEQANEKRIRLPAQPKAVLVPEINIAAQALLKNTNVQVSWEEFCKASPQFRQALHQAIAGTRQKRRPEALLTDVGAPRTLGMVDGVPTAIILDGGSYTNIVTRDFLDRIGVTDIAASDARYILADGRQAPCIGEVQGLQVQLNGVSRTISATVFGHSQFNLLLGRNTMKDFRITTHYETDTWTLRHNDRVLDLDVSYSKEINMNCPSFQRDAVPEAFMCATVTETVSGNQALIPAQRQSLMKMLNRYESCMVEDLDQLPLAKGFEHEIVTNLATPIAAMAYQIPHSREQFVQEEIRRMLELGLIVPSTSPWASPIVVVPKKMGNSAYV